MNKSIKKLLMIFLLIVLTNIHLIAIEKEEIKKDKKVDSNIVDYSEKLIIKPFLQYSPLNLEISHFKKVDGDKTTTDKIEYSPNLLTSGGVSLSYWLFGFSISTSLADKNKSEDDYGKTNQFNFQFSFFTQKYGVDIFVIHFDGYYLKDPENYGYVKGDSETIRSDLETNFIGFNIFYIFADDFSFNSAFKQTEQQNKSGGSFLLMFSASVFNIISDSSLIPTSQEVFFEDDAGFKGGNYSTVAIAIGYAYTLKYYNFYITPVLFLGPGMMNKKYKTASGEVMKNESFIKSNFRVSTGYNGEKYFGGLMISADVTSTETFGDGEGILLNTIIAYIEIFAGARLDWPF